MNLFIIMIGLIIFAVILAVYVVDEQDNQYMEDNNKCVTDCNRAGQEFFDYQEKIFGPKCYCLLNNEVNAIW